MNDSRIYLDYNATSPLIPKVYEGMREAMELPTNPSALHFFGQQAKRWMNGARRTIGDYIDAHPDNIIFTGGGTEANNLALRGVVWDHVLLSGIEHDSTYEVLEDFEEISVDPQGNLDMVLLERYLQRIQDHGKLILLSIILAHNETGVIQSIQEIVQLARQYGAYVHVDAVQALGKMPFSFNDMDVDLMTLAPHKIGGPQGVGALITKGTLPLKAVMKGGGQERGYRSGTENVAAIVGFAETLKQHSMDHMNQLGKWHGSMEQELQDFCRDQGSALYVYSHKLERLPNTTCLSMPHVENATQVMRFDLKGIAVSMGAACSSGRTQVSRCLQKMGPDVSFARGAIRVSSGWATVRADLESFSQAWKEIYSSLEKTEVYRNLEKKAANDK